MARASFLLLLTMVTVSSMGYAGVLRSGVYTFESTQSGTPSAVNAYGSCSYNFVGITFQEADENGGDRCVLVCIGGGSECCDWSAPSYPGDCDQLMDLADDASMDDVWDHMDDEIATGTHSGSYNSNIVVGSLTYYRTVSWSYNSSTGVCTATATCVEDDGQ